VHLLTGKKLLLAPLCPPTCISSAPTGLIFVKFDIGGFYYNLARQSVFG